MKFLKILFCLNSALLIIITFSCEKGIYNNKYNINCNILQNGIINSDSEAVISEINKLLYDLQPKVTSSDEYGHKKNIDLLIYRINNTCPNISAKLICYACIKSTPPQTEIELKTISADTEYVRILDIWTSPKDILRCRTIHVESDKGWYSTNSHTANILNSVFFTDSHTGWATTIWGNIIYTNDGGIDWNHRQLGGYDEYFSCIYFIDKNNGWLLAANYPLDSYIRHTTDGGKTWAFQVSPVIEPLRDMNFIDDQNGWIVADWSTLLITTDGGLNWVGQKIGTPGHMPGVYFTHPDTGWAAGMFSNIVHTEDGGKTWIKQNSPVECEFSKVLFVNLKTGYIIGSAGNILQTTNAGENWIPQSSGTNQDLYDIFFIDTQTGYITGGGGTILYTNDGGDNWIAQSSGTTNSLNSVFFIDYNLGWIVGSNGTVLLTVNGGFEK